MEIIQLLVYLLKSKCESMQKYADELDIYDTTRVSDGGVSLQPNILT